MPEPLIGWGLSRRQSIAHHLQFNHYPPVPTIMVDACEAAIDACVEDDWERPIELPEPVTFKGQRVCPASEIVAQHHLGCFVEDALGEDDPEEAFGRMLQREDEGR